MAATEGDGAADATPAVGGPTCRGEGATAAGGADHSFERKASKVEQY